MIGPSSEAAAPRLLAARTVVLTPGSDVAKAVAAAPDGTTFVLQNGVYHVGNIVPRNGDVISGQSRDGTILDGSRAAQNAFTGSAANVTLSGLTVTNYVPRRLFAAVDGTHGTNWHFSNLRVTNNNEEGLAVGPGSLVDGVLADHNGNVGIGTGNVNNDPHGVPFANLTFTVQNSELSFNGRQDPADAAGAKVLFTNGAVFSNNYVHDNYGFGLWTDAYNRNSVFQGNRVVNNLASGIFHELSFNAIIRDNTISGNALGWCAGSASYFCGTGGISVSDSHDVEVYRNTLSGNHEQIVAYNGHGSKTLLYNIKVHDNVLTDVIGTSGLQTIPANPTASATSKWYSNSYKSGQLFWWNGRRVDINAWHAAGQN